MVVHFNIPLMTREHRILEVLDGRMRLPSDAAGVLRRLRKGYDGEVRFRDWLEAHLQSDCIVLYDLLLEVDGSEFQIDCLVIQQREVWHFEVKNYEGMFQFRDDAFYSLPSGRKLQNPLNQLERGNLLLDKFLRVHGFQFPIRSRVVFINPRCTIYECGPSPQVIHPTHLLHFISSLNDIPSQLSSSHYKFSRKLFGLMAHEADSERVPSYSFAGLARGVRCLLCEGFLRAAGRALVCDGCGFSEGVESGVMRSVVDFALVFPGERITTRGECGRFVEVSFRLSLPLKGFC